MFTNETRNFLYIFLISLLILQNSLFSLFDVDRTSYALTNDPIDVVIPCTEKDLPTLDLCIEGIRRNGKNVNRIIVISAKPYSQLAEWFDETQYPFTKFDLALNIFKDEDLAYNFVHEKDSRIGWIYQQFLKLYAPLVISEISTNVLILDADTIFLNPVEFLDEQGEALFNPSDEYHPPYFDHAKKTIPWLERVFPEYSGISHHMLFQREVLLDFFDTIESYHQQVAWKSLCNTIDLAEVHNSSLSEYEMYFNFAFSKTNQMKIRKLKWINSPYLSLLPEYEAQGYHYASFHSYMRD